VCTGLKFAVAYLCGGEVMAERESEAFGHGVSACLADGTPAYRVAMLYASRLTAASVL